MRPFEVPPIRGPWHVGSNVYGTRYIPGTNRLYARARLGCLPAGAGHGGRDIHWDSDDKTARAVWDGTIHIYPWDDYGNHLALINSDNEEATYCHLAAFHVKDGQQVKADTDLGICDSTGQTSGPHLHFETRTAGPDKWCTAVDPTSYLLASLNPHPQGVPMILVKKTTVSTIYRYDGDSIHPLSPHQGLKAQQLGAVLKTLPPNDEVFGLPVK